MNIFAGKRCHRQSTNGNAGRREMQRHRHQLMVSYLTKLLFRVFIDTQECAYDTGDTRPVIRTDPFAAETIADAARWP
jgi:hypothetical protein